MACTTFLENADFVFSLVGANVLLTWLLFATSLWSGGEMDEGRERSNILDVGGSSPEQHPHPRSSPHCSWLGCLSDPSSFPLLNKGLHLCKA